MTVQALTQRDPTPFFRPPAADPNATSQLGAQVTAVAASKDLAGQLTVVTAEGDKVTLTANLSQDFRSVTYSGGLQQDGTRVEVKGQASEYALSQQLGLTLEGDLNAEETKDLTRLFRKVLNIFKQWFNGQDEAALTKTAKLAERFGTMSSLTELDLTVDVTRSVTVAAAQVVAEAGTRASEPAVLPTDAQATKTNADSSEAAPRGAASTSAGITPPSSGTTTPLQPDSSEAGATVPLRLAAPSRGSGEELASLVERVRQAVAESRVEEGKLLKFLPRILEKAADDVRSQAGSDDKAKVLDQVREKVLQQLEDRHAEARTTVTAFSYVQQSNTHVHVSLIA